MMHDLFRSGKRRSRLDGANIAVFGERQWFGVNVEPPVWGLRRDHDRFRQVDH